MPLLQERWPRLSSLPKVSLAQVPTPLEHASRLSDAVGAEVWIKRDDKTSARYGGNKVRKLEHILGAARDARADAIVTTSAIGSHHVLTTALFGREQGMEVHAVMIAQPRSPHAEENARADLAAGAILHPVPTAALVPAAMAAVAARLRFSGKRPVLVPPGGTDIQGVIGYVEAGLELAQDLIGLRGRDPDAIYVALGSGGTALGLAIGLAAAGVMVPVIAVRVTPRGLLNRPMLSALGSAVVSHLRDRDDRFPRIAEIALSNLIIDEAELGGGYGVPTVLGARAGELAARYASVVCDSTYTQKTLAALLRDAGGPRRAQRLLYVHTLSSAPMEPLLVGAPPLPKKLAALLR